MAEHAKKSRQMYSFLKNTHIQIAKRLEDKKLSDVGAEEEIFRPLEVK